MPHIIYFLHKLAQNDFANFEQVDKQLIPIRFRENTLVYTI